MNDKKFNSEEFKKQGYRFVDWISDYFENIENLPPLSQVKPGEINSRLADTPPENSESWDSIFNDLNNLILPGITHWNHPNFMAYFNSTSSRPGIFAEFISAALNANGMLWKTAPAFTELERTTADWMKKMLGLPEDFWGIIYDTASVSSMHAVAAARELKMPEIRSKGFSINKKFGIYISEHSHNSIEKGALTLGFGLESIKKISVDEKFRMRSEELEKAIADDISEGVIPICAIATIGTTSTTSIDPVKEIAAVCRKYNLWLHIDAAYAGAAAIVPEMKWILEGVEYADSFVVNPHKWMFTPIDLSLFYTDKPEILKRAFSLSAEYLKTAEDAVTTNLMDYGIQLGRRFRALKLWFIIRRFGVNGIIEILREHLRLAKQFENRVKNDPRFELLAPVNFGVVCFRLVPFGKTENELNEFNEKLLNNINSGGELFLSHTKLSGKFTIRISISGLYTHERHVDKAWEVIVKNYEELK